MWNWLHCGLTWPVGVMQLPPPPPKKKKKNNPKKTNKPLHFKGITDVGYAARHIQHISLLLITAQLLIFIENRILHRLLYGIFDWCNILKRCTLQWLDVNDLRYWTQKYQFILHIMFVNNSDKSGIIYQNGKLFRTMSWAPFTNMD